MIEQHIKIIKSPTQSGIELAETIVMGVVVFYVIRPDLRARHVAILKAYRDAVIMWIDIQNTLQSIRRLPETDTDVTRNKGAQQ